MNQISNEALLFLEEAKQSFTENPKWSTVKDNGFIGLRGGLREDCISVYELGNEVGQFTAVLPRQHLTFVEYDELEKFNVIKENIIKTAKTRMYMTTGDTNYYDLGYTSALEAVLRELNKINLEVK